MKSSEIISVKKTEAGRTAKGSTKRGTRRRRQKTATSNKYERTADKVSPSWNELMRAHPTHLTAEDETVYALPERLINAICAELPELLTADDEEFERDLASRSELGFFLGQPIEFPSLTGERRDEKRSPQAQERRNRVESAAAAIRGMLITELERRGCSQEEIDRYFAQDEALQAKVRERQLGYAGWLATSPEFRKERDAFRSRWEKDIKMKGGFPSFPISVLGQQPPSVPKADREFYSAYTLFYRWWGLDRMANWELPVPMRPELTTGSVYPLSQLADSGVVIFLPWYLLRDKDITLREVAEHKRLLEIPEPLERWVDGVPKGWGHDRYRLMLELYVYFELALRRRYGDRLNRNQERLDLAFSCYLCGRQRRHHEQHRVVETVKKVRQMMSRRLAGQ
jgi:hypothetical protein